MDMPGHDDLTADIVEQAKDPEIRALHEDGMVRERLLDVLVRTRKEAGLTQTEVARRLRVRQPTVSKFELEGSDPQLSTIQRYARAIGKVVQFSVCDSSDAPAVFTNGPSGDAGP